MITDAEIQKSAEALYQAEQTQESNWLVKPAISKFRYG